MLSPTLREGAGSRFATGARALALFLMLAGSLAATDLSPSPSPRRGGVPSARSASPATTAAADPDAALQRLAEEAGRIKPSAPDAVARLRDVVRGLIEVERADRREMAALRAAPGNRAAATPARRRSRKKVSPLATEPAPAAAASALDGSAAPGEMAATTGAFFGKRGLTKFHRAGCVFGERIRAEDRVYFKSAQEAKAAGYEACKICKPGGG